MVNPSLEALRASLSERHIGLVEFIGVNLDENYENPQVAVRHSVIVQDFMMFCGFNGSMTTNWHKLLVSAVGEIYDEHIHSIVNAAKQWRTEHQCVSIKESRKGLPTNLHGTSKILSLELALHMGRFIGTSHSKVRHEELWAKSGISDEILVKKT